MKTASSLNLWVALSLAAAWFIGTGALAYFAHQYLVGGLSLLGGDAQFIGSLVFSFAAIAALFFEILALKPKGSNALYEVAS